ncbi:MAG: hypothetical protein ACFFE2_03880 [Candidatus Thorarchaeota archaeon]
MNQVLSTIDADVIKEIHEMIGEEIPKLRSIKGGTTGVYSFGFEVNNEHIVALSIRGKDSIHYLQQLLI